MTSSSPDEDEPKLDVYARPYVPNKLKAVNYAPFTVIPSLPVRWIDFNAYVHSFAGTLFLEADPPPPALEGNEDKVTTGSVAADSFEDKNLESSNYHVLFRAALIDEAGALQAECEDHALYKTPIVRSIRDPRPLMYTLHVPGLREISLRIELGDIVHLRQLRLDGVGEVTNDVLVPGPDGRPMKLPWTPYVRHDAIVWGIDRLRENLTLRIDHLAPWSMAFNACFTVQSGRLGALYRAVVSVQVALTSDKDCWLRTVLFPTDADGVLQRTLNRPTIDFELRDNMLNYNQVKACNTVLYEDFGTVPYMISGPPGTGKTKTLVELALQLLQKHAAAHLLVCAPSDPAADTLAQRLSKHLKPGELIRLNSPSRTFAEVSNTILPFCYIDDDMFSLPPFKLFMRYRIVVLTCRDAEMLLRARLSNADLHGLQQDVISAIHPEQPIMNTQLHWTALLMDEAAQAPEPEALIPLLVVSPPSGYEITGLPLPKVVMAGDQYQLGPRTASKAPQMQVSLFERLLARPLYSMHPLARSKQNAGVMRPLVTSMLPIIRPPFMNLINNYRSHSSILATPSALFYYDTLEPEAAHVDSLLSWSGWRGRGWPVLFACNSSRDEIEQDGGGWYNRGEAEIACDYALSLLHARLLEPHEICIMSPFNSQVRILRMLARRHGMRDVNIGPLEFFQGLESRMVILCTTRTRKRFVEQDNFKGFGVINEPRRFNVALTRAKEGLIVIGNPRVLELDAKWKSLLMFCWRNELWADKQKSGYEPGSNDSSTTSRLERQAIHAEEGETDDPQDIDSGTRKLGIRSSEDQELWHSGTVTERALRDEPHVSVDDHD